MGSDADLPELSTQLLVVGAGMAGMTCAARAAAAGLEVVVVERSPDIGGSALLSGGGFWTALSYEEFREVNPSGEPELIRALVDGYADGLEWITSVGAEVGPQRRVDGVQGFPSVAHTIDIHSYLTRCRSRVEQGGGYVVTAAETESLVIEDGRVRGAIVADRDGRTRVRAEVTLLATGGIQGSAALRQELIGDHAADLVVRSNPHSDGGGFRLAQVAGAAVSAPLDGFYGHLIAAPRNQPFTPSDYLRLAQFYSPRTILLDREGQRFVDESKSYYTNASAVAQLPGQRALLVGDQRVREEILTFAAGEQIDRPAEARTVGANVAEAATLEELGEQTAAWGFVGVSDAVAAYNAAVRDQPDALQPSRLAHRLPLDRAPWFAMEVEPAITFSFRGLAIDSSARVLRPDGTHIDGLLAAGADAGGLYAERYGGGLAMSLVFGSIAARTAIDALQPATR